MKSDMYKVLKKKFDFSSSFKFIQTFANLCLSTGVFVKKKILVIWMLIFQENLQISIAFDEFNYSMLQAH